MQITRSVRWLFLALVLLAIPVSSFAGVLISVSIAPPALPVYEQPPCPGDGYIWTPGYWAYGPDGYYWVPGTWVVAPRPGLLWTPGYWGWNGGAYIWHPGYWGPHVGYYGGVNYGFGYVGVGFVGGEWRGGHYYYNRSVTNVHITNVHVYNKTVINNVTVSRVSYNGGPGGLNARPNRFEEKAMHERHFEATRMQIDHEHGARGNREFLASVNHGRPSVAATARPAEFHHGVVSARDERAPRAAENHHVDARVMNRPVPHPMNAPRPDNRRADDRSMNHNAARPQNAPRPDERPRPTAHNMDRPAAHNMDRPMNAPRPENHGGPGPHPAAYHPVNAPHQDAPRAQHGGAPHPQHENAPHAEHDNGHQHKGR